MSGPSFAIIVASLHGRCGKTLLARAIADYFVLSGERPMIFDTDAIERRLAAQFPLETLVVDLTDVRGQMALFDTLAHASPASRVVDLTHRSFEKFFELMRDTDFISEARARGVEPVVLYIPDRKADSFEVGVGLRQRFPDSAFVPVENLFLGPPRDRARVSDAYRALTASEPRLVMPALAPVITEALEEPTLSLSDFIRRPLNHSADDRLPPELVNARSELRAWLVAVFQEIYHLTEAVARRSEAIMADDR